MMEKIVIQKHKVSIRKVEDFIAAVCYENHLDNYHATISVPVLQAVEFALNHCNTENDTIVITSDYCREGIFFSIKTDIDDLFNQDSDALPSPALQADSFSLIQMLSDKVEVLDWGRMLRLIFHLRGIALTERDRRVAVLDSFFHRALVEV